MIKNNKEKFLFELGNARKEVMEARLDLYQIRDEVELSLKQIKRT